MTTESLADEPKLRELAGRESDLIDQLAIRLRGKQQQSQNVSGKLDINKSFPTAVDHEYDTGAKRAAVVEDILG